jgi:hypothetical protein
MKIAPCLLFAALAVACSTEAATPWVVAPYDDTDIAIEFVNDTGAYRNTVGPKDATALAAGAYGAGWRASGDLWRVWMAPAAGRVPVCRLVLGAYGSLASPLYTPYMSECAAPKSTSSPWTFDGVAFFVALPDAAGRCGAGTEPLYRLYDGSVQGLPQHRYTPSADTRDALVAQGWVAEGLGSDAVFACTPTLFVTAEDLATRPRDVPDVGVPAPTVNDGVVHVGPGIPLLRRPQ